MPELTPGMSQVLAAAALRHRISPEAVRTVFDAVADGRSMKATFSHPELGGVVLWARGGMLLVSDMFDDGLKRRVEMLCSELARAWHREDGGMLIEPIQSQFASHPGQPSQADGAAPDTSDPGSPLVLIEQLAGLHGRGILTDEEFAAKKAELLGRL